jgi:hypothetical protein
MIFPEGSMRAMPTTSLTFMVESRGTSVEVSGTFLVSLADSPLLQLHTMRIAAKKIS